MGKQRETTTASLYIKKYGIKSVYMSKIIIHTNRQKWKSYTKFVLIFLNYTLSKTKLLKLEEASTLKTKL